VKNAVIEWRSELSSLVTDKNNARQAVCVIEWRSVLSFLVADKNNARQAKFRSQTYKVDTIYFYHHIQIDSQCHKSLKLEAEMEATNGMMEPSMKGCDGIESIKVDYVKNGEPKDGPIHGGSGQSFTESFDLNHTIDEHIVSIKCYYDEGVIQGLLQ
ncbi:hypothetical protein HID58_057461, partial [Brassica napus]